jgi:hypothetical protein
MWHVINLQTLNKINMTKIKGLHRFDATFNNMLLHIVVVSLIGGGNRRIHDISSRTDSLEG